MVNEDTCFRAQPTLRRCCACRRSPHRGRASPGPRAQDARTVARRAEGRRAPRRGLGGGAGAPRVRARARPRPACRRPRRNETSRVPPAVCRGRRGPAAKAARTKREDTPRRDDAPDRALRLARARLPRPTVRAAPSLSGTAPRCRSSISRRVPTRRLAATTDATVVPRDSSPEGRLRCARIYRDRSGGPPPSCWNIGRTPLKDHR